MRILLISLGFLFREVDFACNRKTVGFVNFIKNLIVTDYLFDFSFKISYLKQKRWIGAYDGLDYEIWSLE